IKPAIFQHLDLGRSYVEQSVRERFRCCVNSAFAVSSGLVVDSDVWSLNNSLEELNIVMEPPYNRFSSLPTNLQNLKTLVLTMTAFEYNLESLPEFEMFLNSDFAPCLQRIEIWIVEANPILAREIVRCVTSRLKDNLSHPCESHKHHIS